jgi:hypothetical protein
VKPRSSRPFKSLLIGALLAVSAGCTQDQPLGESIFHDGRGEHGRLAFTQGPNWLAHGEFGCATCHAPDGTGRTVRAGKVTGSAPSITAETLLAKGYDRQALGRALANGTTPDGRLLNSYMPRWSMSDAEFTALADFMAGL